VWYIAFTDGYEGVWYGRLLPKRFGHVLCFAQMRGTVAALDPRRYELGVHEMYAPGGEPLLADALAEAWRALGYTVVRWTHEVRKLPFWVRLSLCLPTCVNLVKYVSNAQTCAQTPKGFYNWLTRQPNIKVLLPDD
jgi:hypothetical protein